MFSAATVPAIATTIEKELRLPAGDIADEGLHRGTMRAHHVFAVIRNRNRSQDRSDRHYDGDLDQREAARRWVSLLPTCHRVTHVLRASRVNEPQCEGMAAVARTFA